MSTEILSALLGLVSALAWGSADFGGALASKKAKTLVVSFCSQLLGFVMLTSFALVLEPELPPLQDLGLGLVAGLVGAFSLLGLYTVLSLGRMGIAAPLTAVMSALLPALVGIISLGLPGPARLLGFALALGGIWLISRSALHAPETGPRRPFFDLGLPLLVGLGFGLLFLLIDSANNNAVFWPLAAARFASSSVLLFIFAQQRLKTRSEKNNQSADLGKTEANLGQGYPQKTSRKELVKLTLLISLCGFLDAGANVLYSFSARLGRVDLASVLGSLYPAATILLAWLVLKEKMSRTQTLGIGIVLVAIVLITI